MALNFMSPGAAAGNAIREQMLLRLKLERQAELDAQAKAEQEAQRQQQAAELAFRREQEARIAKTQQAQMDDLANQREFGQVERMVEGARPDDAPLSADDIAKVQRQGFGSRLTQIPGVLMQGPIESGDESMRAEEVGITPEGTGLRPGSKYLDAEAQREATAALAGQAEAGRNERAAADRDMREFIASLAVRGDAQAAALDRRIKELQISGMEDKQAAAKAEQAREGKARTDNAQNAITLLERLKSHPGLGAATGAYEMRGMTQDAQNWKALRNSVVAALALPNMASLKGPASDKDVQFIKEKSTILQNPNISAEAAKQAIDDALAFLQTGQIPRGGAAPQGGAPAQGGGGTESPEARKARLRKAAEAAGRR